MLNNSNIEIWLNSHFSGVEFVKIEYKSCTLTQHVHNEFVVAVVEDGLVSLSCRNGATTAGAGKIIVLPPNEPHFGRVDSHCKVRAYYLNENAIESLAAALGRPSERLLALPLGVVDDPPVARALAANHRAWERVQDTDEVESQFAGCIVQLLSRHAGLRSARIAGRERRRVNQAHELMVQSYPRDLSITELADTASMSKFHFIRTFKTEYGMPPHAYLNQIRLMAAKLMLARGESVATAALAVGLYDQSHLHKLFKRSYGVTPSQYARARAVGAAGIKRTLSGLPSLASARPI